MCLCPQLSVAGLQKKFNGFLHENHYKNVPQWFQKELVPHGHKYEQKYCCMSNYFGLAIHFPKHFYNERKLMAMVSNEEILSSAVGI